MSDADGTETELPLESVGKRLARAREAAGMSLKDLAAITRISVHHLAAIEQDNFAALASRTYAVGFSRSFAKALGLDAAQIAEQVRSALAGQNTAPRGLDLPTFEPGDPARVPSARLAWFAALGGLGVVIAGVVLWHGFYAPGGSLPSILPAPLVETPAAPVASQPPPQSAAPSGPVVFTALASGIWVKFYDTSGKQLMQKQMAQGETWTVPEDQPQVLIWTGRPDALAITIGGRPVPKLADEQRTVRDVPVTAAALLARGSAPSGPGAATPQATATPAAAALPGRAAPPRRPARPTADQTAPAASLTPAPTPT